MRIACSTSAFTGKPVEEALAAVSALGFGLADLLLIEGWAHVNPTDLLGNWEGATARVREALAQEGLGVAAFNVGLPVPLHERGEKARRRSADLLKAIGAFAKVVDVEVAALQPPLNLPDRPASELFEHTVASLREMTETASAVGLTLAIECHARSVFETLEASERLLREAPEVSVAYDPSHFVMAGVETERTLPLLEGAAHVHLRDAAEGQMQVPMGDGAVDFDLILEKLKDLNYQGCVSIEYLERQERSVARDIRRLKERVEAALA